MKFADAAAAPGARHDYRIIAVNGAGLSSPPASAVAAAQPANRFEKEILAFEARDRESPPAEGGILFTGASGIRRWKTLEQDFPHHKVFNRGFGGCHMSGRGVLRRSGEERGQNELFNSSDPFSL